MKYIILLILLINNSYANVIQREQKPLNSMDHLMNNNQNVALNDAIKIDINKTVIIDDDLSITLTDFAHKMTIDDKVATGIAHITITKGSVSEATIISSDTNQQDMSEQYEAIRWNNYIIALEALDYEKSITVTVSKK